MKVASRHKETAPVVVSVDINPKPDATTKPNGETKGTYTAKDKATSTSSADGSRKSENGGKMKRNETEARAEVQAGNFNSLVEGKSLGLGHPAAGGVRYPIVGAGGGVYTGGYGGGVHGYAVQPLMYQRRYPAHRPVPISHSLLDVNGKALTSLSTFSNIIW